MTVLPSLRTSGNARSWYEQPMGPSRLLAAVRQTSDQALLVEIGRAAHAGVDLRPALPEAVREGRVNAFKDLVQRTGDLDLTNPQGMTLLMLAILGRRQLTIAHWLIQAGADVHRANTFGETALYLACHEDATMLIRPLLAAGADPNRPDRRGTVPLQEMIRRASAGPALRTLARLTPPEVWVRPNADGITPLMRAYGVTPNGVSTSATSEKVIRVLLANGAGIAAHVGDTIPQRPSPWTLTSDDAPQRKGLEKAFAAAIAQEQNELRAAMDLPETIPTPTVARARL